MKLLPFLAFEREKIDATSYDCEMHISEFDKVPTNRYAYGIIRIDEFLYANDLVDIVNETLTKNEQFKILKRTENSTSNSQNNFADIENDYDDMSEIEVEEVVSYSQLSVINVTSLVEGKEKCNDSLIKINTNQPSTSKFYDPHHVTIEDSQTGSDDDDDDDVSKETTIPQVVVDQVCEETEKFKKILKEKVSHYLETNNVAYPNFKCSDDVIFPNQVFVTSGNGDKVKHEINKIVKEDNKEASKEGFF